MEAVSDLDLKLVDVYSTPIWQAELPDFLDKKEKILQACLNYKETCKDAKSINNSNINGYQSPPELQTVPELSELFDYIGLLTKQCIEDINLVDCDVFISSAWLNINDSPSCINAEHVHGDTFSGVFYLDCPNGSGMLSLRNPGMNPMWAGLDFVEKKNQYTGELIRIKPAEGSIMIWPSYLPHSVEPNSKSKIKRISISFNIVVLPKGSPLLQMIGNN